MIRIVGRSQEGRRDGPNEDALGWREADGFFFVADGMGGHAAGQVASDIVRQSVLAAQGADLESIVLDAHRAVAAAAQGRDDLAGMGSTVVAARIAKRSCQIVWVGDSRAYLYRGRRLIGLTRDHSYVDLLRENGSYSDTELADHPARHIITQSLGQDSPTPSLARIPLRRGDRILLCTDGLHGELRHWEMESIAAKALDLGAFAEALVAAARDRGGHDDVSVIVAEYDGPSALASFLPFTTRALS